MNPVRCKMPALGETLDMGSGYTIRHGGVLYYGLWVIRHGVVVVGTARSFDEAEARRTRSRPMPTNKPILIPPIRGEPPYDAFLDQLAIIAAERGYVVRGRTALVELALARLGTAWGFRAPRRSAPLGTNRYGEPK